MASFKLFGVSFLSLWTVFAEEKDLASLTTFLGTADVKAAFSKEMVTTATNLTQWQTKAGEVGLENEQKNAVAAILNAMKTADKADEQWRTSVYTTQLLKNLGGTNKFDPITGPEQTAFKDAFNAFAPSQKTVDELTTILTGSAKGDLTTQMQLKATENPDFATALGDNFASLVGTVQKTAVIDFLTKIRQEKIKETPATNWETSLIDDKVKTLFKAHAIPKVETSGFAGDNKPQKLITAFKEIVNPTDNTVTIIVVCSICGLLLIVIVVVIVLKKKGGKKGKKTGENDPINK